MKRAFGKICKITIPLGAVLLLTGCINLSAKAPPALLVLTAENMVAGGQLRSGSREEALVILTPATPRKLNTNRVPVQVNASSIAYLKDAVWADKPAVLWRQLLGETIAARNNRFVLTPVSASGQQSEQLSGTLLEFGVDGATSEAVIIYDAVKLSDGETVMKKRFEIRKNLIAIEAAPVGEALNDAANELAGQVATWIGEETTEKAADAADKAE